ncbi:hypothetical protein [Delftia acidovorans]|uniref:hypothetical protein n=1 Tax=Delftia acidovorans TaxID=80866 RepID=UPI0028B0B32A|nr:hypothetical protein [Delftia acidovorans]
MLYNHMNARGADVYDMDARQKLAKVVEVNTRAGWIKVLREPALVDPRGKSLVCDRIRFRSIYAIRGLESQPCLFHCYGRLQ